MTKYRPADFADDETSSMGSIQIGGDGNSNNSPGVHVRFENAGATHNLHNQTHYSGRWSYLQQLVSSTLLQMVGRSPIIPSLYTSIPSPYVCLRLQSVRKLWRSRNNFERCLLIIISLLVLLVIVLSILMATRQQHHSDIHRMFDQLFNTTSGNKAPSTTTFNNISSSSSNNKTPPPKPEQMVCLEPACIHASSNILNSVDFTVDPCEDFYAFSCNKWIKENPIPSGKPMWGTFGILEQQNQLAIKNVLEKPLLELKSKSEKKAKLYYQSCLDSDDVIEKRGAAPMLQLLVEVGGWNVTRKASQFNASAWNLQQSLQTLQNRYNMGGLFVWAVEEDDKNSSRNILVIDQGGLALPTPENYLNKTQHKKLLDAYLDYMVRVAVLLGAPEDDAKLQMAAIVEFETRIAAITIPADKRRDGELLYHNMTLQELQELAPFIDWRALFEDAFRVVRRKISAKEQVVVYVPEYLADLNQIMSEYNATAEGRIVVGNYLAWQMVRSLTACLSKNFRDAYKGLRKALLGSDGGEEPWRYCVADTSTAIGFAVGAMYVREKFHGQSKPDAEFMINRVREAFIANFKNLAWMDEETRQVAEEKAYAITDMIGFPDYILNPTELDDKYRSLDFKDDEYFENNIRVNVFNLKENLERLDRPVNKSKWSMTPPTANAYYTPTKNQIVFPAGILQRPFYDQSYPKSLNFGAMGVVMGHELSHAFDDQGREYDKFGNLHHWWNNETITKFNEKTNCIVDQYGGYEVNGKKLNGRQTLGENIADNGGLKAAYHAYINVMANATLPLDTLPLPGVNLTHRQLFFVSFAQVGEGERERESIY